MPHTHPVDENIVVLKGSWALGMGGHYRKEGLEGMEPGDYGFAGHGCSTSHCQRPTPSSRSMASDPFLSNGSFPCMSSATKGCC
jgi:hypothetical protein